MLTLIINAHFNHMVEILSQIVLGGLAIFFAILSDKTRRKKVMKFAFMTFIVVSYPVFFMILSGDNLLTIVAHVLFIIPIAASLGPVNALIVNYFQQRCGIADLVYQEI
ncbi:hypothetical protein [Wolbachia endosymbiont of Mansonella perstans]|uniref:hypothetical protein n=1 Tax=Wolbachia endosymbiont of Mansonella perstans TaxID=229526 RepID=UPI001CE040AC|nr:hypothetical protein [Wolbachia endosymbiont of Mansonella perstans]